MKPIVLFGAGEIAEVAAFYFEAAGRQVSAFTVDGGYLKESTFQGKPVVAFEEITTAFDVSANEGFVALSYARMNTIRASKVAAMKNVGFTLTSYVSPHATIFTNNVGENCFILEDNTVQPFVKIGNNVTLWSGNHIGHHAVIEDNVFISSHVVVSGGVTIGENSFLGVNSTIADHVNIAPFTLLGAGVTMLENTDREGIYMLPAKAEKRGIPSTRLRNF